MRALEQQRRELVARDARFEMHDHPGPRRFLVLHPLALAEARVAGVGMADQARRGRVAPFADREQRDRLVWTAVDKQMFLDQSLD